MLIWCNTGYTLYMMQYTVHFIYDVTQGIHFVCNTSYTLQKARIEDFVSFILINWSKSKWSHNAQKVMRIYIETSIYIRSYSIRYYGPDCGQCWTIISSTLNYAWYPIICSIYHYCTISYGNSFSVRLNYFINIAIFSLFIT